MQPLAGPGRSMSERYKTECINLNWGNVENEGAAGHNQPYGGIKIDLKDAVWAV